MTNAGSSTFDKLKTYGNIRELQEWTEFRPNYVQDMNLGPEHVPVLLEIARQWTLDMSEEEFNEASWAPVHAWRALGQLRAAEAVQPLLDLMPALNEAEDDWFFEEFPDVFGLIGPPAVDALMAYHVNRDHPATLRSVAGDGLCRIGQEHPEWRERIISHFKALLDEQRQEDAEANAFIACDLVAIGATETAETIERAFAASCVDDSIVDWPFVKQQLGVEGLGLVPDRARKPADILVFHGDSSVARPLALHQRPNKKKRKAKRKQQGRSRRRNRRR